MTPSFKKKKKKKGITVVYRSMDKSVVSHFSFYLYVVLIPVLNLITSFMWQGHLATDYIAHPVPSLTLRCSEPVEWGGLGSQVVFLATMTFQGYSIEPFIQKMQPAHRNHAC